jgi:hypothetical protein
VPQDPAQDDHQHHQLDAGIHGARIVVGDLAEPGLRQCRPQDDQEQQHIEAPVEDAVEDGGSELVLAGRTGEPGADGGIADQPDGEDTEPVEHCQCRQVRQ